MCLVLSTVDLRPADYLIEKCSTAHSRLAGSSVDIHVDTVGAASTEKTDYSLVYDRSQGADLTIKRKRPLRIVVTKDKLVEFDASTHQYAVKPRIEGELSTVLKHSAGVLDELVAALTDPEGVKRWLSALRKNGTWKFGEGSGTLSVETGTEDGRLLVSVYPDTMLLKHVSMKSDRFGTDWTFRYKPAASQIEFTAPKDAYLTNDIRPEIVTPTYDSLEAKRITEAMFAKYDNPKALAYEVRANAEKVSVWVDHGRVRQRDEKSDWTMANGRFLLLNLNQKHQVSGAASLSKVINAVAKTGARVEPLLRLMMRGINPFRFYLGHNSTVSVSGKAKVDGRDCALLTVNSPSSKLSLIVRTSDGFVLSLASLSSSANGESDNVARTYKELRSEEGTFQTSERAGWPSTSLDSYVAVAP